ncbi:MAG TPA: ATP-binding protein [Aggregatilineaceae bacterium]|nr:ATP-binding protein [Aggregatilineaceae bacterium]
MKKLQSLRVRLILAYAGLIVLGFGGLALIAGQQISNAARDDYELQLSNEVILVGRGVAQSIREYEKGDISEDELYEIVADYESQTEASIGLYFVGVVTDQNPSDRDRQHNGQKWHLPQDLEVYEEFVAASHNTIIVVQRNNDEGESTIYTAAPIVDGLRLIGYVHLSEPASQLQRALYKRWSALGLGVLAITGVALLASVWLSTSLIRPLGKLRDSALRLSQGDLAHRITDYGTNEFGEVAKAFNQMADRVKAMIEEQRAFASNTSHELRTPLTTMRLRTEALRYDDSMTDTDREQYIVEIDEELIRLSGLVEDLILLSRFDAGRAERGQEWIDLARFAHSLYQAFSIQAAEKDITLQVEVQIEQPEAIEASLNHLTILCRNLLENAIKYTPAGGRVVWRVGTRDGQALFTVQDTGPGIAPEHLPHLFERFYRADKARSRSIQGTGLGLALAKSIVEAYNGRIEINSPGVGQGTTVTAYWPMPHAPLEITSQG